MRDDANLVRPFIFYVTTLLLFAVGGITSTGLAWYAELSTPSWTPPDLVVAFVWGTLFFCMATSLTIFWEQAQVYGRSFKTTLLLYTGNAMLILLWNYLFFGAHLLVPAFGIAVIIGISVCALVLRLWKSSRNAALLLLPYLAWMVFALCLTYTVILMNP